MTGPFRPSLRARLLRQVIARGKNTAPIADTIAAGAAAEVDGRPDPTPSRRIVRGLDVTRTVVADTVVWVLRPHRTRPRAALLYLHGGGYIEGASVGTWMLAARFARRTQVEVWVPAYRLAPRQTADTTVPTITAIYRRLTEQWPARKVTVAGDSAGGGLALAATQHALATGLPAPGLLGLFAPWVEVTMTYPGEHDSQNDPMLDRNRLVESGRAYAGTLPTQDPRVSPLHGTMTGLPNTWIITGTDDILVHQSRRLRNALYAAQVPVHYLEDPGMIHVHVMLPVPEARKSLARFEHAIRDTHRIST